MDRRRGRHPERGDSLVEFAVSVVLFLTTIFGTMEFGLGVWQYNMLSNLAQEGARWAAVRGSTAGSPADAAAVRAFVESRSLGLALTAVTTTWPDAGDNAPGKRVQVVVQKDFTPLTLLLPHTTLPLSSRAQMIIAR